ncbi:MAG TPA: DUF2336 domain-containing protein [Rhizomicrobium sp.]
MTLTATSFGDVTRLMELAANPQFHQRGDIYRAVASLYRTQGPLLSDRERALMRDILSRLTSDVEMAIRVATAERIADDPHAPLDLILFLINDRIEVARPIVLRSQRLTDQELLRFVAEADVARQALCAERPSIGAPVTEALAQCDAEPVLVALARNVTAHIAEHTFALLVEKSKSIERLQEPLVQRPDLPPVLASKMCEWVSDALKTYIARKHASAPAISQAIQDSAQSIQSEPPGDIADSSRKLIEKLATAGQLKPGFLLRVLQQGQIDLFELGFARLLQLDYRRIRPVLYEGGPRTVAMACRAVGIDRCVFPTVYNLSRQSRRVHSLLRSDDRVDVETVFNTYSKAEALARLQAG